MQFSLISQIYIVSSLVGSGFMVLSTLLGGMPRHGAHAGGGHGVHVHGGGHAGVPGHGGGVGHGGAGHGVGHGGHGGAGHGGAAGGHGRVVGHSAAAGHSAASGHNGAAHGAGSAHGTNAGHAAHAGHSANASHGANAGHGSAHGVTADGSAASQAGGVPQAAHAMATTGPVTTEPSGIITRALGKVHGLHVELKEEGFIEAVLGFFNPMSMATFMTFFGVAGILLSIACHMPIFISLPVAILSGWLAVQVVIHVIAWLFENMGSSSEAKVADIVGRMGEVTLPIDNGKLGEVTYIIKSKRYSSPAKSVDPTLPLGKRMKVMICELQDHIVLVEPWTDTFIDPDFDSPKLH